LNSIRLTGRAEYWVKKRKESFRVVEKISEKIPVR